MQFFSIKGHKHFWQFGISIRDSHSFNTRYFNYSYIKKLQSKDNTCKNLLITVRYLVCLLYHNISQSICLHWFLIFIQNHHCKKSNIGRELLSSVFLDGRHCLHEYRVTSHFRMEIHQATKGVK